MGQAMVVAKPHQPRQQRRCRRTRQPLKKTLVSRPDLSIETRQAQCSRRGIEKGREPTEFPPGHQRPLVGYQGWRDAKRNHIREAIVFGAEIDSLSDMVSFGDRKSTRLNSSH